MVFLFAALLPAADWKPLFNGKDLTGWEMVGPGRFLVESGMLKTEGAWVCCGTRTGNSAIPRSG